MSMHMFYIFIGLVAFFSIVQLISNARARRRPAASSPATSTHMGPIVDQTLGRTIGAWIIAIPVDVFAGNSSAA